MAAASVDNCPLCDRTNPRCGWAEPVEVVNLIGVGRVQSGLLCADCKERRRVGRLLSAPAALVGAD